MAPKNNPRFAQIVAEAFEGLGVTQDVFHNQLGGPSDSTLRKITDGKDVGVSVRTLAGLDRAFGWRPGSAARTLAGGNPTPLTEQDVADDVLVSKLRHPSRRFVLEQHPEHEMTQILHRVIDQGAGLDDGLRASITRFLEDQNIAGFSGLFDALTRDRKLRVVAYGTRLHTEQFIEEHQEKESVNDLEAAPESSASSEGDEDEEAGGSLDDPKLGAERVGLDEISRLIVSSAGDVDKRDDGGKQSG